MKRTLLMVISVLAFIAIVLAVIFQIVTEKNKPVQSDDENETTIEIAPEADVSDYHLRDNEYLYKDVDDSVITMYLTVYQGNASDNTNHTWKEINSYSSYDYENMGVERYKVSAVLQVGDDKGPSADEFGYGVKVPNATVTIRGQSSTKYSQKNYRIQILDGQGNWNGQTVINLNKHMSEGIRFRNKLGFDILSEIPQLMSLRTQFVHLYVCDKTSGNSNQYVDYGLYTQVEQVNKTYLKIHGLDKNGYLYKVNYFDFNINPAITTVDDPNYNKAAFETYLEVKGREDHQKLIDVINKVNDYSIPTEELLDTYFDRENIAYWMAYMILIGNTDTQNRNMFLYSPLNVDKWYIIAWDLDASLIDIEQKQTGFVDFSDWEKGVSNYWGNALFKRALLSETFRDELDAAIEDIYNNYLTADHINELAAKYSKVTRTYLNKMPDILYAPLTSGEYENVVSTLADNVANNYGLYKRSLLAPMPGFVDIPSQVGSKLTIKWDPFYDFANTSVTYNVKLAKDYQFKDIIFEESGLYLTEIQKDIVLKPGQYFIHVDGTNEAGYKTNCFDYYVIKTGKVYGTYCFWVDENGKITAFEATE